MESLSNSSTLVTMDVSSLYTCIPHEDIRLILDKHFRSREVQEPASYFLLELHDLIIEKNYFRLEHQFYFQMQGVVMGSSAPPTIANLFMVSLKKTLIYHQETNLFLTNVEFYG